MASHSGILAWRIPWTEEPGGLQSTGSQRVRKSESVRVVTTHTHSSGQDSADGMGTISVPVGELRSHKLWGAAKHTHTHKQKTHPNSPTKGFL